MSVKDAISRLDNEVADPEKGLPLDIFYYISRTTPLINVDLLIKDEDGRTMLAWRDDEYAGTGWHVPGGIIRFRETMEERLKQVALEEIGYEVGYNPEPMAIHELIHRKCKNRSHFISILYDCRLSKDLAVKNDGRTSADPGFLKWHEKCPDDMIPFHDIYRQYI